MAEVARAAEVSTATVSRVLRSPERVAEPTRTRVQNAMLAMDYAPNLAGKSLRTSRTERVLVLVPDISNPFFSAVLRGIEEEAQRSGYAVLLGDTRGEAAREDEYAAMFRRREADCLILLGHRIPGSLAEAVGRASTPLPIVFGCEYRPGSTLSSVRIDNAAAGSTAVSHLVDLGHRRIGVITGPLDSPLSQDRLKGARDAVRDCKIEIAVGDFSIQSGEVLALEMLSTPQRPTAIFAFSDEMAIGTIAAARSLGLQCPTDISVVGFDDIRIARSITPPLTTIQQPMAQIGREVVRLVLATLNGEMSVPTDIVLPYILEIRESTAKCHS